MDAQLKAKWIEALRSGEYKQCTISLRGDDTEPPEYCCLGVLCVVANKEPETEQYTWLDKITGGYSPFVRMNDDEGKTFPEIADYIETNL